MLGDRLNLKFAGITTATTATLKWTGNIVEGWWKIYVIFVRTFTYYIPSTVLTLWHAKDPEKKSQTTNIFMVFYKGLNL